MNTRLMLHRTFWFGCLFAFLTTSKAELKVITIPSGEIFAIDTSKIAFIKATEGSQGQKTQIMFQNVTPSYLTIDAKPTLVLQLLNLVPSSAAKQSVEAAPAQNMNPEAAK